MADKAYQVPKSLHSHFDSIVAITDEFCRQHLDEEYGELCRKLTAKLARKRPTPILRGDVSIWAGGVLYALGQMNFLFDPSQSPHMRADRLVELVGGKRTTISNKARLILDTLDLGHFSAEFARRDLIAQNSAFWLVMVNGFIYDARTLPREIQEDAFAKGIIPYVPDADGNPV